MELLTQFEHEDLGRTYEMADDEQLLVSTTNLRNDSSELKVSTDPFVVLADTDVYQEKPNFDQPELGNVETTALPRVEHRRQFSPEGLVVGENETRTAWRVYVVPRTVDRADVEIVFDYRYAAEHDFPIRWLPSGSS